MMQQVPQTLTESLVQRAMAIPQLFSAVGVLPGQRRFVDASFLLEIGAIPLYVCISGGRPAPLERGPAIMRSWSFAIRGGETAWEQFWRPVPLPQFHDIFSLAKRGDFVI